MRSKEYRNALMEKSCRSGFSPTIRVGSRAEARPTAHLVQRRFAAALFAFAAFGEDALQANEAVAFVEPDQAHTLGIAALDRDFRDRRAHQRAAGADQHDLVVRLHQQRPDHLAVALADLQGDDALPAAAVDREILDQRALAIAVLRSRQHHALLVDDDQRDHLFAHRQADAAHARRRTAHRPHVVLVEADRFAAARAQDDLAVAVGDIDADQAVGALQLDRDDAGLARTRERFERGLLDRALR